MAKGYVAEEQKEVYKLVMIVMIVIAVLSLVYLFSRAFISKDLFKSKEETKTTTETKTPEFNYSKIIVGELLNRPYDEYYVIAFDNTGDLAFDYNNMISAYNGKTKLYTLDLNDGFNKKFASDKSNPQATSIEELAFGEITLLKVKNGKIVKYLEDKNDIRSELKI